MKPTQEQIEAALRYSDCKDKRKDLISLLSYTEQSSSYPIAAMKILAAAYRDQQRELKKIKIENNNLVKDMILHERMSERFQDETERMKEEVDSVNKEVLLMKQSAYSIETMVDRFLSWQLPKSVCADLCATTPKEGRYGTNLLSASEAKEMIEHLLGVKIQIDESVTNDTVIVKGGGE